MMVLKETTAYRKQLRAKIMEAAMKAFTQKGIRAVKMDDIASSLAISKRTLYEIFEDKEHLLYETINQYDAISRQRLTDYAAQQHSVIDVILEAYRMKVEEIKKVNPAFYTDIIRYPKLASYIKNNNERTRESFIKFLERGVEEGFLRADVNYEMIPHMFDALGEYMIKSKLLDRYSLDELFTNYVLVSIRGICTEAGLKAIEEAKL
jgi:AcrR family transcriptional regulator